MLLWTVRLGTEQDILDAAWRMPNTTKSWCRVTYRNCTKPDKTRQLTKIITVKTQRHPVKGVFKRDFKEQDCTTSYIIRRNQCDFQFKQWISGPWQRKEGQAFWEGTTDSVGSSSTVQICSIWDAHNTLRNAQEDLGKKRMWFRRQRLTSRNLQNKQGGSHRC